MNEVFGVVLRVQGITFLVVRLSAWTVSLSSVIGRLRRQKTR